MTLLTKEQILAEQDIPIERVSVPEWGGGEVIICGLSAAAKNLYQQSLIEIRGKSQKLRMENATAKLLVLTIVDEQKTRLFTETDIEKLGTKSAAALERLVKVANRLSGMDEAENEAILKNSDATQSDDSPIVSL